jgi:hypothetical protein
LHCTGTDTGKKKVIRIYNDPAGGWGALKATGEALTLQGIAVSGAKTLLHMNQPEGFDCPGCAWPDPKHTSSFEFCENGAKAVAWEATVNRCTPGFVCRWRASLWSGRPAIQPGAEIAIRERAACNCGD